MEIKDLIGHTIQEIRFKISSEGDYGLEGIEVEIKLKNDLIISYPYDTECMVDVIPKFSPKLRRVFPTSTYSRIEKSKNILSGIANQVIIGIWRIPDDFGDELCGLEFSNGYLLTKGAMSPIGTGNADLYIFDSIESSKSKYGDGIERIY